MVIEAVTPVVDAGRFPVKRTVGELVRVYADAFADGHDVVACAVLHRHEEESTWHEQPMAALGNDVFAGEFRVTRLGRHLYSVRAWIDRFGSWSRDLAKRLDAGQDVTIDLEIGRRLVQAAADRADAADRAALEAALEALDQEALGAPLATLMRRAAEREFAVELPAPLAVAVDRERARFSAWYELFPRSCSDEQGGHGTFADVEARLPYVASMGFDVLYLPPIHPIGHAFRKGPNNAPGRPGRRCRQPVGDRRPRGRPHGDPSRARHVRGLRPARRAGGGARHSRSRSTSRSSARPTTRG